MESQRPLEMCYENDDDNDETTNDILSEDYHWTNLRNLYVQNLSTQYKK